MSNLWREFVAEASSEDWRDMCDVLGLNTWASTPSEYQRFVTSWADEIPVDRWREIEILLEQRAV